MSTVLDERYGRRSTPRRRRLILSAAAGAAVFSLAWIAWVTLDQRPALTWQDLSFAVRSDAEIQVTFDVTFTNPQTSDGKLATAVCSVQALNALRTEVGTKEVSVQAGRTGRVRAIATMATSELAVTGLVRDCVLG